MEKVINSEVINKNGWLSIFLTRYSLPLTLVFGWQPATSVSSFKYPQADYFLASYTEYNLPGVRENEQPKKAKYRTGKLGCLFVQPHKSKSKQTTKLSRRGVAR